MEKNGTDQPHYLVKSWVPIIVINASTDFYFVLNSKKDRSKLLYNNQDLLKYSAWAPLNSFHMLG